MDYRHSPDRVAPTPIKIIIAGGFGVGKTTAVTMISDSPPLTTEAAMTDVAAEIDRTGDVPEKVTTTVAIDFGTPGERWPARPRRRVGGWRRLSGAWRPCPQWAPGRPLRSPGWLPCRWNASARPSSPYRHLRPLPPPPRQFAGAPPQASS